MQGLHLTADLYRCRCEAHWLTDAQQLGQWCLEAAGAVRLQVLDHVFRSAGGSDDADAGASVLLLLAGSHVCVHTWPQPRTVTLDVYLCDPAAEPAAQARALLDALARRFAPEWTEQRSLDRGGEA